VGEPVLVRYFAAARAAAGVSEERVAAGSLAEVLVAIASGKSAQFARVLAICSFLVDEQPVGSQPHADVVVAPGGTLDVLPPFAGGAGLAASAP